MSTYTPFAKKSLHTAILVSLLAGSGFQASEVFAQPTPTPTPFVDPDPTPTPTPTPTPSASPSPSASPVPAFQGFAIEDNELTITGGDESASFSQTATISPSGVVDHVDDVPSTDGVGIPSFSFELITQGLTAGQYDYRVAVIFDKEGSESQIEAKIESLILTVAANGTVTGTIPAAGNSLRLLGRNGNGALQVQMNVTNLAVNGPVTISGGEVTFNGERLISRIRNSNPAFDEIILEEFDETASYDYRIVVQQKSGPETAQFVTVSGSSYTLLPKVQTASCMTPCAISTDVFKLNPTHSTGELASGFTNAYSVTGSFNVVPYVAPTPTPDDGGSGGGGDDDVDVGEETEVVDGEINDIDPEDEGAAEAIGEALEKASNLAENAADQIASGTLSDDAAVNLLGTLGSGISKASDIQEAGGNVNTAGAVNAVNGVANIIDALANKQGGVSAQVLTQITTIAQDTVGKSANLISATTSVADIKSVVDSTSNLLNATIKAGAPLSESLVTAAVTVALKAVQNVLPNLAATLGLGAIDFNNPTAVSDLLRSEPAALSSAITNSPAVSSRTPADETASKAALAGTGINPETAARIFASLSAAISNPDGVSKGGVSATQSLLNALARAFGVAAPATLQGGLNFQSATGFAVVVDAVTGALRVNTSAESYAATSTGTRLVPSVIPEGVSYLADGRAVAVADGVAVELSPSAADILGFAAAVEKAGFPASFNGNGSLNLALGGGQRFSGAFAYDNIAGKAGNCGAISFQNPTGAVNAANYAFKMICANGIQQNIVPFIDNAAFYTALSTAGLSVTTDRNTGALTIGTAGRFKPSFFVNPLTSADQTFLTQNGTNGFAFRAKDVNGDGRADYEVISSTGVQVVYKMP